MASQIDNPFSGAAALGTMNQMAQFNPLANAGQRLGEMAQLNQRDALSELMAANGGKVDYTMAPTAMLATPQAQKMFQGQQGSLQKDRGLDMTEAQHAASNALQRRGQDLRNSLGWAKHNLAKKNAGRKDKELNLLDLSRAQTIKSNIAAGRQQAELTDVEMGNTNATQAYDQQNQGVLKLLDTYTTGKYNAPEVSAHSETGTEVQAPTEQLAPLVQQAPAEQLAAPIAQGENNYFPDADTFYRNGQGNRATFGSMESPIGGQNPDGSYKRMDANMANRVNSQVNAFGGETLNDGLNQGVKQSAAMQVLIENARRQNRGETPWTQEEMSGMVDTVGGADWSTIPDRAQKPGSFTYTDAELEEADFKAIATGKVGGTEGKRRMTDFFLGDQRVSDQLSGIVGGVDAGGRTANQVNQALINEKAKRLDKSTIKGAKDKANAYKGRLSTMIEQDKKRDDMVFSNGTNEAQKQFYKDNPEAAKNLKNKTVSTVANAIAKDPSRKGKQTARAKVKNVRDTFDPKSYDYQNMDALYKSLDPHASESTNVDYIANQFGEDFDKDDSGLFTPGTGTPQKALTNFADSLMNKIGFNVGLDNWETLAEPKFFDALNAASMNLFGKPVDFKEIEKLTHETGKGGNFEQEGWLYLDNTPAEGTKLQKLIDSAADIYSKNQNKDATAVNRLADYREGMADTVGRHEDAKTQQARYGKTAFEALTEGFSTPKAVKDMIQTEKNRAAQKLTPAEEMVERSRHTGKGLVNRLQDLDAEDQALIESLRK